ncbi:MAG: isocitrate lyase, partial [Brevundimonas sp.]|nr:isocitrate lyase [Brevundimonas sp.]
MTTFADLVPSPKGRFDGIERPYTPEDVLRLRGSVPITHTLAERGANRLWELLHTEPFINALGAVSVIQFLEM